MQNDPKTKLIKITYYYSTARKIPLPCFQPRQILHQIISMPALPRIKQRRPRQIRMVSHSLSVQVSHFQIRRFFRADAELHWNNVYLWKGSRHRFQLSRHHRKHSRRTSPDSACPGRTWTRHRREDCRWYIFHFIFFSLSLPVPNTLMPFPSSIALYESYHTLSLHPSEPSTLQRAANAASLDPITSFLEDSDYSFQKQEPCYASKSALEWTQCHWSFLRGAGETLLSRAQRRWGSIWLWWRNS